MEVHISPTKAGHLLSVPIFKRDREVQTNHQPEGKINEILWMALMTYGVEFNFAWLMYILVSNWPDFFKGWTYLLPWLVRTSTSIVL